MKKVLKITKKITKIKLAEDELKKMKNKLKRQQAKFKREQEEIKKEVNDKMVTLITSAFSLVAALAWNETIKTIFQRVFGTAQTVWAMLIYAVLVTIIAVWITYWITKRDKK